MLNVLKRLTSIHGNNFPSILWAASAASREILELQAANANLRRQLADLAQRHANEIAELKAETRHDPLTGILNRRGRDERLQDMFSEILRHNQDVTNGSQAGNLFQIVIILSDIDHFKTVNDNLIWGGHDVGDQVLKAVAEQIQTTFRRPSDVIARHLRDPFESGKNIVARNGGEEFAVFIPCYEDQASRVGQSLAETLRSNIEKKCIIWKDGTVGSANSTSVKDHHRIIQISQGVAFLTPKEEHLQSIQRALRALPKTAGLQEQDKCRRAAIQSILDQAIKEADAALYAAKDNGRNCVYVNFDGQISPSSVSLTAAAPGTRPTPGSQAPPAADSPRPG